VRKRLLVLFIIIVCLISFTSKLYAVANSKSSPNYLIILVHGIAGHRDEFWVYGDLESYLRKDMGLDGYVYSYDFSDNRQSSVTNAKELGSRTEGRTYLFDFKTGINVKLSDKCWLEQAKDDFVAWFTANKGRSPTSDEVPNKYILIAHSMGGLASRYYITSDFYRNDVVKLIALDSPHTGADGVSWYNRFKQQDKGAIKALYGGALDNALRTLWERAPVLLKGTYDDVYVSAGHWSTNFMSKELGRTIDILGLNKGDKLGIGGINLPISYNIEIANNYSKRDINGSFWENLRSVGQDIGNDLLSSEQANIDINAEFSYGYVDEAGKPIKEAGKLSLLNVSSYPFNFIEQWGGSGTFWLFILSTWDGPGLQEMNPDSVFLQNLKSAVPHVTAGSSEVDPIQYRLVSARGVPTPSKELMDRFYYFTPYSIGLMLPFMSEYNNLPTEGEKAYAALLSTAVPGSMCLKDGSMLVAVDSSRGDSIEIFKNDTRRYDYLFKNHNMDVLASNAKLASEAIRAVLLAQQVLGLTIPVLTPMMAAMSVMPTIALAAGDTFVVGNPQMFKEYFFNHGYIVGKSFEGSSSIIEQALDDTPLFGGNTSTAETKSGISASSVNTPTSSYNNYDQAFVLLSDLDSNKEATGVYHTVTIEAVTEGNPKGGGILFPIEFDGQKKWVSAVTVKEAPTAVKGVINTFLPKKLKVFQYSENFAAWRPIENVNPESGEFVLEDLPFAEGQNVIAVRSENAVGIKSNQLLKIILNTIPMVASNLLPLPGTYTNNNQPTWSGEFAKAAYAEGAVEDIAIQRAIRRDPDGTEVDVTGQVAVEISGGAGEAEEEDRVFEGEEMRKKQHRVTSGNIRVTLGNMRIA
jgi:pimeloyl-ACP methyl ester carboxylesterase